MSGESSTREELLDAAFAVLVERGYDRFTTAAIAEEADRSQSLVHYYFETKEDLVVALFDHVHDLFDEQVSDIAETDDPTEHLLTLIEFLVWADAEGEEMEETVAFKRGLLELVAQAPYHPELREVLAADIDYLRTAVTDAVRDGVEQGAFREVDPEAVATLIVATVYGAMTWGAVFGADADDGAVVEMLQALVREWLVR